MKITFFRAVLNSKEGENNKYQHKIGIRAGLNSKGHIRMVWTCDVDYKREDTHRKMERNRPRGRTRQIDRPQNLMDIPN